MQHDRTFQRALCIGEWSEPVKRERRRQNVLAVTEIGQSEAGAAQGPGLGLSSTNDEGATNKKAGGRGNDWTRERKSRRGIL